MSEHDTIRDCVHIYCDWLSALYETPKVSVPKPVCNDPNLYARKIISHFYNLFVPRKGEGKPIFPVLFRLLQFLMLLFLSNYNYKNCFN